MKELETLLKVISEGMRTLAGGVTALAEKVDEVAKKQAAQRKAAPSPTPKAEPAPRPTKTTAAESTRKAKSAPKAKKTASGSATTTTAVFNALGSSGKGVDSASIQAKTGLNARQVSNAVYKLKKAGRIKSVKRGAYIKA